MRSVPKSMLTLARLNRICQKDSYAFYQIALIDTLLGASENSISQMFLLCSSEEGESRTKPPVGSGLCNLGRHPCSQCLL